MTIHTRTHDEAGFANSEALMTSDVAVVLSAGDEALEERSGANDIDVGDLECIEERRDVRKEVVHDFCVLLHSFEIQQEISMSGRSIRTYARQKLSASSPSWSKDGLFIW